MVIRTNPSNGTSPLSGRSEASHGSIDLSNTYVSVEAATVNSDPIELLRRTHQRPTPRQRTALQMLLSHKTEESSQIDSDIQYTQLEMDELKRREDDLERADAALEVAADAYRSTLSAIVSEKVIKKLEDLELANSVKRSKLNAFRSTLISSRMTELRKKLDVLERVSPAKAANVVAYEHILSSVRLLPPSILGIIFQYATQRCPNTLVRPISPVALSHVCFVWRNTAIGIPQLWSNLEIQPAMYSRSRYIAQSNYGPITARMSKWASRAGAGSFLVALEIGARGFMEISTEIWTDVLRGFQAVTSCVTHFSTPIAFSFSPVEFSFTPSDVPYTFSSESDDNFPFFFALPGSTFPVLETLRLVDITELDWGHPRITLFEEARSLRRVALGVLGGHYEQYMQSALPWGQLTHLDISGSISPQAFAHVMFSCWDLQSAAFDFAESGSGNINNLSTESDYSLVTLTHLTKLRLRTNDAKNLEGVFRMLELPSLTSLEIEERHETASFPLSCILPCMSSSYNLKVVSLFRVESSLEDLTSLLISSPELEKLQLYIPNVDPKSILRGTSSIALPRLSSLLFAFTHQGGECNLTGTAEAFFELTSAWRRRGAPLETIKLSVCTLLKRSDPAILTLMKAAVKDVKTGWAHNLPPSLVPGGSSRIRARTMSSIGTNEQPDWPPGVIDVFVSELQLRSVFDLGGWESYDSPSGKV